METKVILMEFNSIRIFVNQDGFINFIYPDSAFGVNKNSVFNAFMDLRHVFDGATIHRIYYLWVERVKRLLKTSNNPVGLITAYAIAFNILFERIKRYQITGFLSF